MCDTVIVPNLSPMSRIYQLNCMVMFMYVLCCSYGVSNTCASPQCL